MTDLAYTQELVKEVTDPIIKLYEVDLTAVGGSIFRLTNMSNNYSTISFKGFIWVPFPIDITGLGYTQGEAPAKPVLVISNVTKLLQASVAAYGDVVGGKITRYQTFRKFLADGATPNNNAHKPADTFLIDQKTSHNKSSITWNLISKLDIEEDKLPGRQMLRDPVGTQYGFPGLSTSTRIRN